MKPWKIVIPLAGVPLLLLLAWGMGQDPRAVPTPLVGTTAPDFSRETLQGDTLRLSDLGDTPLVINFWASWCIPCAEEHPLLVDFERRYHGRIRLIGVVYEDTRANAIRWYQERGGNWTNVMDPRGRMAIDYGVRGVPETFFITRDRRILLHLPKPVTYDVLELWASKILAPDSTTTPS
ncbi:MAG: redoxin domain-containing protein [Gemmatimonadetes bacterium]|nr:redoxin domain-containing protein [Gemmatimonadota bacterium]